MSDWGVIMRPVRQDSGSVSYGGLALLLTDGADEHEVSRVAFARDKSKSPKAEFGDALQQEIAKAEEAADLINDYEQKTEAARQIAVSEAQDRIREIMGSSRSKKMA